MELTRYNADQIKNDPKFKVKETIRNVTMVIGFQACISITTHTEYFEKRPEPTEINKNGKRRLDDSSTEMYPNKRMRVNIPCKSVIPACKSPRQPLLSCLGNEKDNKLTGSDDKSVFKVPKVPPLVQKRKKVLRKKKHKAKVEVLGPISGPAPLRRTKSVHDLSYMLKKKDTNARPKTLSQPKLTMMTPDNPHKKDRKLKKEHNEVRANSRKNTKYPKNKEN